MPTDEILKAKGSAREDALASIGSGLGAQNMHPPLLFGAIWLRDHGAYRQHVLHAAIPLQLQHQRWSLTCASAANAGLGTSREGFHSGWGWDSHGSVTCHSYGCGVNYATSPSVAEMANAKA